MRSCAIRMGIVMLATACCVHRPLAAQEDVADIPSQDRTAEKDENKRYFLVGPHPGVEQPKQGYGLLIVMPGGDGSAEFHPFVKRIYKHAVPEGYLLAQPVAVKWDAEQEIVWPTAKTLPRAAKFSTEAFVAAVIKEIAAEHPLDPARIFTLTWSSSGPAAYAISVSNPQVKGSFIAMSVYKPEFLPQKEPAQGQRYYLYHSPDDRVCPFRMAEQAAKDLEKLQATVKFATYAGGHGWRGNLYQDITAGLEWLEASEAGGATSEESTP